MTCYHARESALEQAAPVSVDRGMKIVARSATELIIRDSAAVLRWFGAFVVLLGAFAVWMGASDRPDGQWSVVPVIIGAVLALAGLALVLLPSRSTFAFSRTERAFVIVRQRLGRVRRSAVPLRDVADVSLEESRDDDGGRMYRVATTLTDQRRIPWTSYYTSGYASKQSVVDAARDFLGLAATPRLGHGTPTAPVDPRDARRGGWLLGAMGLFCLLFVGIGLLTLAKEHHRLSTYRPVEATVLRVGVDTRADSDGSTYAPLVEYRYRVAGRTYTASRVTPLNESRSGRWAHRLAARFSIGAVHTAYYDPDSPADAFLVRSRSIIPWAFIGMPLVMLTILVAAARGMRDDRRLP